MCSLVFPWCFVTRSHCHLLWGSLQERRAATRGWRADEGQEITGKSCRCRGWKQRCVMSAGFHVSRQQTSLQKREVGAWLSNHLVRGLPTSDPQESRWISGHPRSFSCEISISMLPRRYDFDSQSSLGITGWVFERADAYRGEMGTWPQEAGSFLMFEDLKLFL
jgi:hypothetical protein